MKYSKETYSEIWMYKSLNGSTNCRFRNQYVVRSKQVRYCGMCSREIPSGNESLYIEDVWKPEGWFRCWICEDCCNRWMEATKQVRRVENNE